MVLSFEQHVELLTEYMNSLGLPTVTMQELREDYSLYLREESHKQDIPAELFDQWVPK